MILTGLRSTGARRRRPPGDSTSFTMRSARRRSIASGVRSSSPTIAREIARHRESRTSGFLISCARHSGERDWDGPGGAAMSELPGPSCRRSNRSCASRHVSRACSGSRPRHADRRSVARIARSAEIDPVPWTRGSGWRGTWSIKVSKGLPNGNQLARSEGRPRNSGKRHLEKGFRRHVAWGWT